MIVYAFKKKEIQKDLGFAALVGFFADLFSSHFFGLFILLFVLVVLLIRILRKYFELKSFASFLPVLLAILVLYYLVLGFSIVAVLLNFVFGILLYLIFKLIYVASKIWIRE